ncbi:cell division protein FtsA [Paracidobacterium acidisoli]|uniref:Cell division protein FtsA n=1 Tax=Paracidobacterium acidisoli TaxID=2303751 RepID=A0A372IKR3_9BACT|nr:cell division protein FtsA [Paracidobacterium acidisoli]MBT9332929.1 cell division protein FtsA [Paracidobacterium acidisoli]
MSQKPENLIAVVDAGSSKTRVLVAEVHEGALRYRGHGIVDAAGVRRGVIADLGPAAESFNKAATLAEEVAQGTIEKCVVGIGGPHIRGVNSRGGISLGTRLREIGREDVRAAVDRARSISLPGDREVIHLLPQQFILDEQPGIHDPVGMVGNRLEVNLHITTASASAQQSIITCANKAGLEVTETVFEAVAAAEATLSADERELGVCLIDIGAASSEIIVFFEGSVAHTSVIPIGGDHFTNDLAVGLHATPPEAEWLKCNYGHAVVTCVSQQNEVEVMGLPGYEPRVVRQRFLAEILEPRARELFHLLRDNLRQGGVLEALGAGCVLTGGGARLPGLPDTAESLLRVPARIAVPVPLSRMPAELSAPECATLVGTLLYAHRTSVIRAAEDQGLRAKLRAIFAGSV